MVGISDFIAFGVLLGLVSLEVLPSKIKRMSYAILLIVFGALPFLYFIGAIGLNIYSYPITKYAVLFSVIIIGRCLFAEGVKEQNVLLKIPTMLMGLLIIFITAIPTLHTLGAISFTLPDYLPVIDFFIYIAAGILGMIGSFTAESF